MEQESFATYRDAVLAALRAHFPAVPFTVPAGADQVQATVAGAAYGLQLASAYRRGVPVATAVARYVQYLASIVAAVHASTTATWATAAPQLALQLRPALASDPTDPLAVPLPLPGLALGTVLDLPDCTVPVTPAQLTHWGVAPATVLARARCQTLDRLPPWQAVTVDRHTLWRAEDGRGFAGAAIALPEAIGQLPIATAPIWIAGPSRDVALAFAGGLPDADPFVREMAQLVAHLSATAPYGYLPTLYRIDLSLGTTPLALRFSRN